ncbi:hypothetical protein CYMTET_25574 [Cymbomonas tetramitiformis]|uniref:Uncharacterized protein n=1 Tax=Cymbomonas tetramitiformis TaxID=36881 RepID=A0AAE0FTH7_9CHLO|nr:hypothetical protein CYMTET_25574 [Cymbomonas tetramitiformis]
MEEGHACVEMFLAGTAVGFEVDDDADIDKLAKLVVSLTQEIGRMKLQAEHSVLCYPAKTDRTPILAKEQRLFPAVPTGENNSLDEMTKTILTAFNKIENYVKATRRGGPPARGSS